MVPTNIIGIPVRSTGRRWPNSALRRCTGIVQTIVLATPARDRSRGCAWVAQTCCVTRFNGNRFGHCRRRHASQLVRNSPSLEMPPSRPWSRAVRALFASIKRGAQFARGRKVMVKCAGALPLSSSGIGSDLCTARTAASSHPGLPLGRTILAFSTLPSGAQSIATSVEMFGAASPANTRFG